RDSCSRLIIRCMRTARVMAVCPAFVFTLLVLVATAVPQTAARPNRLKTGNRSTVTIFGTETHSYALALKTGEYFSLRVEQFGIDVVVDLFGPDGKMREEFDSPTGPQGPEVVSSLADASGDYRVEVRPFDRRAKPGSYEIQLDEVRP